jgi:signal transduction histidine kinase
MTKFTIETSSITEALQTYMLEDAPFIVLFLDVNLNILDANALAHRVLNRTIIGKSFEKLIVNFTHPFDISSLVKEPNTVHRLTLNTDSGMPETLNFRFFPLPTGTLALGSVDLEEQLKLRYEVLGLNRELNDMTRQLYLVNADLREMNELKNHFIGMAAHDLRKPVGIIITYCEFLLDEAGEYLSDELRGFLRTSLNAAIDMKRLIDNFLEVSVIESGHLRMERSWTTIEEILAGVLPLISVIATRKKIELIVEAADVKRVLSVDITKIQQVLVNLLNNAIEHSTVGQRIWMIVQWEDALVKFSVRDEGQGITPEDQKKLFAAFVHAGTRKTAGERSVGLGLSIARLIVEAHHGHIWVESEPGHGSTFFVALPLKEN